MVAYYRLLGAVAALALLLYGLFSFAALTGIGATLTLPGIAGFVLAIGMAVDANVLVFERIKEEHAAGRHLASATANGFKRAWSAIADSNATTLLAAILLFFLASGPVKGFGITLALGVGGVDVHSPSGDPDAGGARLALQALTRAAASSRDTCRRRVPPVDPGPRP
jgi:SecD/SecF fusion protein